MKGELVQEEPSYAGIAIPGTGEVLDLANPEDAALAYFRLDELATKIKDAQTLVRRALLHHANQYGGTTMRLDAAEVKVTQGDALTWDLNVLAELKAAGLPDSRWGELVTVRETVERKVNAAVAKQIAKANPEYAKIIDRALTRTPKPPSVSVALRADQ